MSSGLSTIYLSSSYTAAISAYAGVAAAKRVAPPPSDKKNQGANSTKAADELTVSAAAREAQSKWDIRNQYKKLKAKQEGDLTAEEKKQLEKYKAADREVRAHEQAHLSAAGNLAVSGASFQFATGPDGACYAMSGEVNIDTSPIPNNPAAMPQKAQQIESAAMAPAQPSPQDRSVAAQAASMAAKARHEMMTQKRQDQQSSGASSSSSPVQRLYSRYLEPQQPSWVDLVA